MGTGTSPDADFLRFARVGSEPVPILSAAGKPLTSENLLGDFGARAAMTRGGVAALMEGLDGDDGSALARWKVHFSRSGGAAAAKLPQLLARPAARYGVAAGADAAARLLLALQTYYALLVEQLIERLSPGGIADGLADSPFAWWAAARSPAVGRFVGRLREAVACYAAGPWGGVGGECDVLGPLYQGLFPRPLRRQLGEYYTPDWLARHVLDEVGYRGGSAERLLDPACGSGTFLVMALRRWRGRMSSLHPSSFILHPSIVGFDLNPLAVMTARANYLLAIADLLPQLGRVEIPVYLHDSIQDRGEGPAAQPPPAVLDSYAQAVPDSSAQPRAAMPLFDYVVGNPPWIAWDNLSDEDRRATKPLWERYGLFSLSGSQARHGGGKKDLSMLMLYAAADRYLKPHGRLGMVVTQTLFQTLGAGDGFRRFRLGRDGPPLGVLRVDDLTALRPFGDAANWTSTIVLEKGAATEYPVPYFKWEARPEMERHDECGMMNDELPTVPLGTEVPSPCAAESHHSSFIVHHCQARPVDPARPTSPWLIEGDDELPAAPLGTEVPSPRAAESHHSSFIIHHSSFSVHHSLPADYAAHLGANSGGANGVYWLEVLGESQGGLLVRNSAARGKHRVEVVEAVIEPDLLYPLLRWGGVGRYRATPRGCILLAQDPATRSGIEESAMQARWPRTLAYLERFRELLTARAAYRRYQQTGPFYSMYNVGPYTTAPVKVVWRRMDRRINAVVLEPSPLAASHEARPPVAALSGRPIVPQETCVLVACDSADEAHYLCAVLNSAVLNALVAAHSVRGGKSFGTPGMFDFLPLRRYRPDDHRHRQLAALSRHAHAVLRSPPPEEGQGEGALAGELAVADAQREIDRLAGAMWRQ